MEHVSVQYRLPTERIGTFREYFIRLLQRRSLFEHSMLWMTLAFKSKKAKVFGFIGDNGAGKSTLLKVVARVLRPYKGRVVVRGKVAPLLELGAGFHPELTGRENIYSNGSLLGHSRKQMEEVYPESSNFLN